MLFTKRAACMLLAFVLFFTTLTLVPLETEAAEGTAVSKAYILEIATGITSGSQIKFFEIYYTGTDNKSYKKVIFPNGDSLALGRHEAENYGSLSTVRDDIKTNYGYDLSFDPFKTGKGSGLQSNSIDQYYFTTGVAIKSVDKVEGFMGGKGTWTCTRFQIYRVDRMNGLKMAGYWSNNVYIDFQGELIAELTGGNNNWNCDDANFLRMNQAATLKKDFNGVSYKSHPLQSGHSYGFRMDFADTYGAGLECLAAEYQDGKTNLAGLHLAETMTLTVTYTDVYGQTRFLRLPVITSTAAYTMKSVTADVMGLAQQGQSIGFAGTIPDCATITEIQCTFGAAEAVKEAGIKSIDNNETKNRRAAISEGDDVQITCIAVYNMNQSSITPGTDEAQLTYDFKGNPILYRLASTATGDMYYARATSKLNLKDYDGRELKVPATGDVKYYLVELTADDVSGAGTDADMLLTLDYVNKKGKETSSKEISLSEAAGEYFGYWPGDSEDFVYRWGVNGGNTLSALVSLNDVQYFTGVKLRMPDGHWEGHVEEDYQLKNLKIYSLSHLGGRKIVWKEQEKFGMKTNLEITREYEGRTAKINILNLEETVLVQEGQTIAVDAKSSTVGALVENSWEMTTYNLSYENAMKDFNFSKVRKTYEVTVKVFDDSVATDNNGRVVASGGNGDSGSENLFYFQLVFQNGESNYVLANQQLAGDRFASGASETFQIDTNQDYGEVTAIRIIPDDRSSDSKKYDKLRIDYIQITERGVTGTHTCWMAENVGWIGTNYTEEQEQYGMGGRQGRTFAEISKNKTIDYATSVVQLEVSLHTNTTTQPEGYASQFYGNLHGAFTVEHSNGQREKLAMQDLVKMMYQYMNKTPQTSNGSAISDKSRMFRENHTDRFLVDIRDVKKLIALDLQIRNQDDLPYQWDIGSVSVKLVTESGVLRLNNNSEYEYSRTKKEGTTADDVVCTQAEQSTPAFSTITKAKGGMVSLNIPFTDNEIELYGDYNNPVTKISRQPATMDTELNVFVFPTIGGGVEPVSDYELDVLVDYAHIYGPLYQTGDRMHKYIPDSDDENARPMFYINGLRADGMIDLNKIKFTAETDGLKFCKLDYAIVQQVKAGVVVANYYVNLGDANAYYSVAKYPSDGISTTWGVNEQHLTFQLGESSPVKNLFADRQDMAVALKYKLVNDPENRDYLTPYIYLTDQNVTTIRPGQMIDIMFNQMFVGEVTGIQFVCIGGVEASVEAASVTVSRSDSSGITAEKGYYSFGEGVYVEKSAVNMAQTADTVEDEDVVRPASFTFKTSEASKNGDSGTSSRVWMRIYTVNSAGVVNTPVDIDDIRKYLVDGSENFETDETQTIRLMLKGAAKIRRVEIEPKSAEGTASWSVDSVTAKLEDGLTSTSAVGERIREGSPKVVTLESVYAEATVWSWNAARNANDELAVDENGAKLIAQAEKEFIIRPNIKGSERGATVTVVEEDEDYVSGELPGYLERDGSDYIFTPPETEEDKYYLITVASAEVPESKTEIRLKVKGTKPAQTETNTGTGTGDNSGTGTGDSGGTGTGDSSGTGTGDSSGTGTGDSGGTGTGDSGGTGGGTVSDGDAG